MYLNWLSYSIEPRHYAITILPPHQMVRANPIILGEDCSDEPSHNWYIIAKEDHQYITVDLNPANIGRCYDSFWETHGLVGDCQIVSLNFTTLLKSLYESKGKELFWLNDKFIKLGDAYDN